MKKNTHTLHTHAHTVTDAHTPAVGAAGCTQFSHERAGRTPFERKPEINFGARLLFMRFYCTPKAEQRAAACQKYQSITTGGGVAMPPSMAKGKADGAMLYFISNVFLALAAFICLACDFPLHWGSCCRCRRREGGA